MVYIDKSSVTDTGDSLLHGSRVCKQCKIKKDITEFHYASNKTCRRRTCKSCTHKDQHQRVLDRKNKDPDTYIRTRKNRELLSKYGMTYVQLIILLTAQHYKCQICEIHIDLNSLNVDHDHTTGKVRGLLCGKCNRGLGMFGDSVLVVARAVKYLAQHVEKDETDG